MRVAIIASPRSGNSWLRVLLAETLGISEFTTHNWHELVNDLPQSCVMQVHWYREPGIQAFLRDCGFRVVTIARHPLDVLLSVLRFCKHDPNNARWLEGNCEVECLFDKSFTPISPVFLDWCLGFGCENLFSVTYQWMHDPGTLKTRYEDLVSDPCGTVAGLARALTGNPAPVPDEALEKYSLAYWQALPNKHGWQGKAGLWKELFTAGSCRAIHDRHRRVFDTLGYNVDEACETNSEAEISKRWVELNGDEIDSVTQPAATVRKRSGFLAGIVNALIID